MKGGSLLDRMESEYRSSVNTKYRYINMLNFLDFLRLSKVDSTFSAQNHCISFLVPKSKTKLERLPVIMKTGFVYLFQNNCTFFPKPYMFMGYIKHKIYFEQP